MFRRFSSWITASAKNKPSSSSIDVEQIFLDKRVQSILRKVTGLSTTKIFHFRQHAGETERPSYKLMTKEEFDEAQEMAAKRAKDRLQIPPFKNAREEEIKVITRDPEIAGGDNAKMVFYDISPGLKPRERLAVVREIDGTLRVGTGEERDRLYRTFFPMPSRPVFEPGLFSEPSLTNTLDAQRYEFILDYACWYFEPDDPKYIKVSAKVYDHIDKAGLHEMLWSTRHYGALVFYLTINRRMDNLIISLLNKRKLADCADVVRLYRICHSDSKTADAKKDLDLVKNFVKSDANNKPLLDNVVQAFEEALRNKAHQTESGKEAVEAKSQS